MSLRFGIFEFHPATGELYRHDALVRLQAQPAQVLGLLLSHAGRVVTRTELKDALWGTETFVDFDRGLNFCIAQIRAALSDSAEAPIYIKTFPKRGYQFIAPVAVSGEDPSESGQNPVPSAADSRAQRPWLLLVAGLIVGFGITTFAVRHFGLFHQPDVPSTRVAVARFDNETGDASFDRFADALTDSVTEKLTVFAAGRYGVIGNAAILRVPRNRRDLLAIGSSLNAGYVVLAQVRRDSSHCFVLAHLIRLPDQTHVAVTELNCSAIDPLQLPSDFADGIATRFSPLIAR